jgi:hypothetical protein
MTLCNLNHEHQHGIKTTCYHQGGCRCDDCKTLQKARSAQRRKAIAYGRLERRVDATGTIRRIQALNALGWADRVIGSLCGYTAQDVYAVKDNVKVTPWMRDKIAAVYETLSMRVPENSRPVAQVRASAKRNGYVPPLAWNDIDADEAPVETATTDDIDEVAVTLACQGQKVKLTRPERNECIRRLHARRYTDQLIADTIHTDDRTVLRTRQQLGLKAFAYSELVKRGAA